MKEFRFYYIGGIYKGSIYSFPTWNTSISGFTCKSVKQNFIKKVKWENVSKEIEIIFV